MKNKNFVRIFCGRPHKNFEFDSDQKTRIGILVQIQNSTLANRAAINVILLCTIGYKFSEDRCDVS